MAKIQPGQMPSAVDWNAHDEASEWFKRRILGNPEATFDATIPHGTFCKIRNTSSQPAERYDVLGIDGVEITPSQNLAQFIRTSVLTGVDPEVPKHTGKFAICLEPINPHGGGDGPGIGTGFVAGYTPAYINILDESHEFADVAARTKRLTSASMGKAQIIYQEPGTGEKWCLVVLGGGGAASEQRFGVLNAGLGVCELGSVTVYHQVGSDCPLVPIMPIQTLPVRNFTDHPLIAGPLMKINQVANVNDLEVFPAQIEECVAPQQSVNI